MQQQAISLVLMLCQSTPVELLRLQLSCPAVQPHFVALAAPVQLTEPAQARLNAAKTASAAAADLFSDPLM